MDSMIDQKVFPHPQLPPPQQMHPNLMNQRPPNHQMIPHPPHPHSQYQQQQQQQQPPQMQHQQPQHSVRPPMVRMQNTMPMQPMHQPSGPVNIKPNVHNSMPSNVPFNNNSNNSNSSNNDNSNNNNDSTSSNATASAAANSHVFTNGSHGSSNQPNNSWKPHVKQEQPHCSGCQKPIYERHLLKAVDQLWHEDCLKCSACGARLGEVSNKLWIKANLLLCKTDYLRMFGQTGVCSACSQRILPYEMIMKAKSNFYHMDCFACHRCQHRFCIGDRFFLHEGRVLCENDCENRSAIPPQNVNMRGPRAPASNQVQSKQKMTNARAAH